MDGLKPVKNIKIKKLFGQEEHPELEKYIMMTSNSLCSFPQNIGI